MERLKPIDIFNKDFKYGFRGYNVDEVNEFLDLVIKNFENLIEENQQLKEQLNLYQNHALDESEQDILIRDMLRRIELLEAKMRD